MSTNYIHGATTRNLGRFENVTQGSVVALTAEEVAMVAGDADFAPVPAVLARDIYEVASSGALSADNSGKLCRTKQTAAIELDLTTSPVLGENHQIQDAGATGATTHNITIDPGATNVISGIEKEVSSIAVSAAGTGFTSVPTVAVAGDGASATATAKLKVVSVAITAGGTAYEVGDVLTIVGGTSTTAATVTVATVADGVITGVTISNAGVYSAPPANSPGVTRGAGTAATFALTWGVQAITVTASGTGYTAATASVSGGAGTGCTLAVTLAPKKKVVSTTGLSYNVYWNGLKWIPFS